MTIVQIDIPDSLLEDFYEGMGANPDTSWTDEEKRLWLENMILEPYITDALLRVGSSVRQNKIRSEVAKKLSKEQEELQKEISQSRNLRLQNLPESIRPPVDVERIDGEDIPRSTVKAEDKPEGIIKATASKSRSIKKK